MHEFQAWPKTARLFRDITVTEKIDGTNAGIHITGPLADWEAELLVNPVISKPVVACIVRVNGAAYAVTAQSRKRIITPGKTTDHFGFAGWVYDNAHALVSLLGEGLHYGEWWGQGIQRGYGIEHRCFSLFNTDRHAMANWIVGGVRVRRVPVLYHGPFSEARISSCLSNLAEHGSVAAPGFANPEGICVFHSQSRTVYKVTLDNQDRGKWEAA